MRVPLSYFLYCLVWALLSLYARPQEFASNDTVKFLVLMETGSVGSSWIMNMLDSHPNILAEGEYINGPMHPRSFETFFTKRDAKIKVDRVMGKYSKENEYTALGLKVKRDRLRGRGRDSEGMRLGAYVDHISKKVTWMNHTDRIPELSALMAKMNVKLLCLFRKNYVKHAISQVRHWQMAWTCSSWEAHSKDCVQRLATQPLTDFASLEKLIAQLKTALDDTLHICRAYKGPSALLNYEVVAYRLGNKRRKPWPRLYRHYPNITCPGKEMQDLGVWGVDKVSNPKRCRELCNNKPACVSYAWYASPPLMCQLSSRCTVSTATHVPAEWNATLSVADSISVHGAVDWVKKNKIWDNFVCTNIGAGGTSYTSCQKRCARIPSCTAFNMHKDEFCYLRSCPPDTQPEWGKADWQGYHVAGWKKNVNKVTIRSLDDLQAWLGVTPRILSSTNMKTTPPNLKHYLVNYDKLRAWMAEKFGENSEEFELFEREDY